MRLDSPFNVLHVAICSACGRDLPEIKYQSRDWEADKNGSKNIFIEKTRRPRADDVEITMFAQTWASTALGYGGVGGSALTPAYTIIVEYHGVYCVYFGSERLAYRFDSYQQTQEGRERFRNDMRDRLMASVKDCGRYR